MQLKQSLKSLRSSDSPLHVLIVITLGIYPHVIGGAEIHTFHLAKQLVKSGFRVTIFAGDLKEKPDASLGCLEGRTRLLKIMRYPLLGSLFSMTSSLLHLAKNPEKIDVIHAQTASTSMITGFFLSHLLGVPLIVTCHGLELKLCRSKIIGSIHAYILKRAFHVTCVSADLSNILINKWGVARSKISVIPNGYDHDLIERLRRNDRESKINTLVFVGSLRPIKDPLTLIKAARLVMRERTDVNLYVIGDGKLKAQLEDFCTESDLPNIFFLGDLPHEEALSLMARSDILLLTSKDEGLPTVIVEAMALGRCVIATSVGGVPEIISNRKNGMLVPAMSPSKLAQAVIELLENDKMRRRLSARASEDAEKYSWDRIILQYLKVYTRAVVSA